MSSTILQAPLAGLGRGRFRLVSGGASLEVDSRVGARVVSLKCEAAEVLTQPAVHPDNYGSTFWDAPQSAWGWPPRAQLDSAPYEASIEGDTLVCRSAVDAVSGLSFQKRFTALPGAQGFAMRYRIRLHGDRPQRLAPWEVTRVPGGLSFYPSSDDAALPTSALELAQPGDGLAWYAFDATMLAVGRKHFGATRRGWLAHVTPSRLLFVKQFERVVAAQCAAGHAPVEIWGQDGGIYVELENHGACVSLAPGDCLDYSVRWLVCELPPALDVRIGNPALPRLVEAMLQRQPCELAVT